MFERINLHLKMLEHIFIVLQKAYVFPLISRTLTLDYRLSGNFLINLIKKLRLLKGQTFAKSPFPSFNVFFGAHNINLFEEGLFFGILLNKRNIFFNEIQSAGLLHNYNFNTINDFISLIEKIKKTSLYYNKLSLVNAKSNSYFLYKISNLIKN
jgi:hypothetical protein